MSERHDKELQRYFDGELTLRHARQIQQRLRGDPAEVARLSALQQTGNLIRAAAEGAADDADFSSLLENVSARLDREEQAVWAVGWRSLRWLALALPATAAVVLGMVLWWSGSTPTSNECVIETLDVGPHATSTIFTIEDPDSSGGTTVIWVSERS